MLGMIPQASDELLLCVDSDFDYLFHNSTEQSRELLSCDRMFHTYAYATENFLCYAPSLHNVCVKATKNDTRIFDFVKFMHEYSCTIYPLFLWYAYSAQLSSADICAYHSDHPVRNAAERPDSPAIPQAPNARRRDSLQLPYNTEFIRMQFSYLHW